MDIAFAAFDLDGTLLEGSQAIEQDVVDSLKSMIEAGVEPVLITGRSLYSFLALGVDNAVLDLFGPVILLQNGNVLWHRLEGEVRVQFPVPSTAMAALHRDRSVSFVADVGNGFQASDRIVAARYALAHGYPRSSIRIGIKSSQAASRLFVYEAPNSVTDMLRAEKEIVVHPAVESDHYIVLPSRACKSTGLTRYLHQRDGNVNLRRVVSFGDGVNDVCLLSMTGAGVSMAVAHQEAVEAASIHLTGSLGNYLRGGLAGIQLSSRTVHRCWHDRVGDCVAGKETDR